MKTILLLWPLLSAPAFAAAPSTVAPAAAPRAAAIPADQIGSPGDTRPNGRGIGTRWLHGGARRVKGGGNGISYHGGPLILGGAHVYYIWYGNWTGNTATAILPDFAANVGGSPYFNINTTYYDGANTRVANAVTFSGSANDNYSRGAALSDADVQAVVARALTTGGGPLPADRSGVYFVLTSADVNETSGFCTSYCGWHTHASISGTDIKYAFVGNSARCPSACAEQSASSPNGNPGADGMASVIAHELEEAVTDPDLNAWYTNTGRENADLCAWTFGATTAASNGSVYNMTLGTRQYLIQQNWVNAGGGYCALKYP